MAVYKSSNPHSLTDTFKKQLETGENNFVEALENSLQQPREHPVKKKPHWHGRKFGGIFTYLCPTPSLSGTQGPKKATAQHKSPACNWREQGRPYLQWPDLSA